MMSANAAVNEMIFKAENKAVNDGDYLNSQGLWMCGKCNTPKQIKIEVLGKVRKPMCLCRCEAEKREKERSEKERQEEAERIERVKERSFLNSCMTEWTFEKDDGKNPEVMETAKSYVENFEKFRADGKGLLLFGDTGTGKTFTAACIVNELIQKGYSCKMTNFATVINELSGLYQGKQDYIDELNRNTMLVIDDLAAERDTEYMNETVFNIIDARYRAKKPLIITTNLTSEELKNPSELRKQRIYSRLFEMCIPINVKGGDRRKEKLKEDVKKYKEILKI